MLALCRHLAALLHALHRLVSILSAYGLFGYEHRAMPYQIDYDDQEPDFHKPPCKKGQKHKPLSLSPSLRLS